MAVKLSWMGRYMLKIGLCSVCLVPTASPMEKY